MMQMDTKVTGTMEEKIETVTKIVGKAVGEAGRQMSQQMDDLKYDIVDKGSKLTEAVKDTESTMEMTGVQEVMRNSMDKLRDAAERNTSREVDTISGPDID